MKHFRVYSEIANSLYVLQYKFLKEGLWLPIQSINMICRISKVRVQIIHRQQLSAHCNSNYPTEKYSITYLHPDIGMTSCLKQDFSTKYTTPTKIGVWNSLASFGTYTTDPYRSGIFTLWLVGTGEVCVLFWNLWTKVKKASLFSERLKHLVKESVIQSISTGEFTRVCKSENVKITGIIWPFSVLLGYLKQCWALDHLRIKKTLSK